MSDKNGWARRVTRRHAIRSGGILLSGVGAAALIGCSTRDGASRDGGGRSSGPNSTGGSGAATAAAGPTSKGKVRKPKAPSDVPWGMDTSDPSLKPKHGGTLRLAGGNLQFANIDPRENSSAEITQMHSRMSSRLLETDSSAGTGPFDMKVGPSIASTWEQPDPTTLVFKINPKAKWQNRAPANGRNVVADDVKFTYDLYSTTKASQTIARFEFMDRIEVVDPSTLRIKLKRPTPEVVTFFAHEQHPILLPEWMNANGMKVGAAKTSFVGSGPFILKEFTQGVGETFVRNPDYWEVDKHGQQLPYLDGIKSTNILEPAAQRASFNSKQVDRGPVTPEFFKEYAARDDIYLSKESSAPINVTVQWTWLTKPYEDVRVRKAISMGIDRKLANEQTYGGYNTPPQALPAVAYGSKPPTWDEIPATWKHNPAEAKKLLAAAGFEKELDLGNFDYDPALMVEEGKNALLLFQQQLAEIGIKTKPRVVDRATRIERLNNGAVWSGLHMTHQPNFGPTFQLHAEVLHSKVQANEWAINDPKADALVEKLRTTLDMKERESLFKQLLTLDYENCYRMYSVLKSLYTANVMSLENIGGGYIEYKNFRDKHVWFNK